MSGELKKRFNKWRRKYLKPVFKAFFMRLIVFSTPHFTSYLPLRAYLLGVYKTLYQQ